MRRKNDRNLKCVNIEKARKSCHFKLNVNMRIFKLLIQFINKTNYIYNTMNTKSHRIQSLLHHYYI